jgi:hypothetical protein
LCSTEWCNGKVGPSRLTCRSAAILSDDDTLAAIRRGLDDLAEGAVVTLEQVRDEHTGRERT